ncbi:MAG: sugar phosphate isomerase/epimerase [Anaerolineae bacterium]|nr:sugar phosphate isomerase/epimerase [Anaerolineae bacterium]
MLRFGIEMLQPSLLIEMAMPALARQKDSAQFAPPSADAAVLVERIADLGFSLVELNTDLNVFFPDSFGLPTIRRLQALKESQGLSYTVHLPLWSVEPSTPVQWVREGSVEALVDAVLRLSPLEPEAYVLHATGALAAEFSTMAAIPDEARPLVIGMFQRHAAHSVEELLRRTALPSRAIAVETIGFPFDLTLALAEELDLSLCFDTGHVLAKFTGPISFEEALQRSLPRLAEVHLHDGYYRSQPDGTFRRDDHLPLGKGDLPLDFLLDTLKEAGFEGPIIFELTIEEAKASLEYLGPFLAERWQLSWSTTTGPHLEQGDDGEQE